MALGSNDEVMSVLIQLSIAAHEHHNMAFRDAIDLKNLCIGVARMIADMPRDLRGGGCCIKRPQ